MNAVGRFWFNRGIATFGRAVQSRVEKAADSSNPVIAKMQRMREWERLMGGDMDTSAVGFADPTQGELSPHARAEGRDDDDDDDEMAINGAYW